MAPPRAVAIIRQIASALDAAHNAGVMHRDIKPANILLTTADFAYLVDFGIASATTDEKLTSMGSTIGTWRYMAPERFTSRDPSYSVDTYALACVLFESLTGSPPYPGTGTTVMTAHLTHPIPRASSVRPGIPVALDDVIARGMAKDPADRYRTTGALAQAAQEALSEPDQDRAENILTRSQIASLPKMSELKNPSPPTRRGSTPPPRTTPPPSHPTPTPPRYSTPTPQPYRTPTPQPYRTPTPQPYPTPTPTPQPYRTPTPQPYPTPTPQPYPTPTSQPYPSSAPPPGPLPQTAPSTTAPTSGSQPWPSQPMSGWAPQTAGAQPVWGQPPMQPPPRGGRTWLLVGAGAAAALIVVVALVVWLAWPSPPSPSSPPSPPANAVKLQVLDDAVSVGADEAPKTIDVFNEPICPPCGQFIRSYSTDMQTAINNKKIQVHYHLLNFLDSKSASGDYSTRAVAAALCVASANDPKLYIDFYAGLFGSSFQPKENASADPTDDDLAGLAESVGAQSSVTDCIKSSRDLDTAKTKAANGYSTLQGLMSQPSTPSVFDGQTKIDISDSKWLNRLT
jgi:serine/threonine-protein kinase